MVENKETEHLEIRRQPEVFSVVDPSTKKVLVAAGTLEELQIQILVSILENTNEIVKNTR